MREEIYRVLGELGFGGVYSAEDERNLEVWRSWYEGDVRHFHSYPVFNGQKRVICRRASLGMAKKICEDWANLLMNEQVSIRAEGKAEQTFLDRVWEENRFFLMANRLQESKAALGTAAYVPRMTEGKLKIDYLDAGGIFPLNWENGRVSACAFASPLWEAGKEYLYLQLHHPGRDGYDIENLLFSAKEEGLVPVPLRDSEKCAVLPGTVHTGREERPFVLDRMNIVNNRNPGSPMGMAVFANAIDQLRGVDVAYDSYVNEFILGKKRIMVKPEATRDYEGVPLFDADEMAFYILPEDSGSVSVIREIDMSLRTKEHHEGIQDMLNLLGMQCGLGEQHYRFEQGAVRTATEVISRNSGLYRSVRKHELLLEASLKELCRLLLGMGNDYCGEELEEDVALHIDFDDSIIEDRSALFERDCRMLTLGVLGKEEFRQRWREIKVQS